MDLLSLPYPFPTGFGDALTPTAALVVGISILGVVGVAGSAVSSFSLYRREQRARREAINVPLDDKMNRIMELSLELRSLNSEVQSEFELQVAATKRAKEEAEQAQLLASLSDEQRRAAERMVGSQISAALDRNGKKDRRFQFWLTFGSFAAGVIASAIVSILLGAGSANKPQSIALTPLKQAVEIPLEVVDHRSAGRVYARPQVVPFLEVDAPTRIHDRVSEGVVSAARKEGVPAALLLEGIEYELDPGKGGRSLGADPGKGLVVARPVQIERHQWTSIMFM